MFVRFLLISYVVMKPMYGVLKFKLKKKIAIFFLIFLSFTSPHPTKMSADPISISYEIL